MYSVKGAAHNGVWHCRRPLGRSTFCQYILRWLQNDEWCFYIIPKCRYNMFTVNCRADTRVASSGTIRACMVRVRDATEQRAISNGINFVTLSGNARRRSAAMLQVVEPIVRSSRISRCCRTSVISSLRNACIPRTDGRVLTSCSHTEQQQH